MGTKQKQCNALEEHSFTSNMAVHRNCLEAGKVSVCIHFIYLLPSIFRSPSPRVQAQENAQES